MKKIIVLIADDHTVVCDGLRLLLQTAGELEATGETANGQRAVDEANGLQPDMVLLEVAMPRLNGVEAARRIMEEVPAAKVLILAGNGDDPHTRKASEAGADGNLLKETAPLLSSRQLQIVQLIAEGFSSTEMANVLSVSIKTIEKHRQAAMDKLDIHEIATLTRYAVSTGAVELKPYDQLIGYTSPRARNHSFHRRKKAACARRSSPRGVVPAKQPFNRK